MLCRCIHYKAGFHFIFLGTTKPILVSWKIGFCPVPRKLLYEESLFNRDSDFRSFLCVLSSKWAIIKDFRLTLLQLVFKAGLLPLKLYAYVIIMQQFFSLHTSLQLVLSAVWRAVK